MESRKRNQTANSLERGQRTLKRRAYGRASYVAGDDTLILIGGKTLINGQLYFIPLGTRRQPKRHCKSCGSFRKSGSCTIDSDTFTHSEANACAGYWNRTYDHERREALATSA